MHHKENLSIYCNKTLMQMLQSGVDTFYKIPGVPGKDVKPELDDFRVFIQSTSQGARCLKRGDIVLYIV